MDEKYPWFTLGMTRATLRSILRSIEDDHQHITIPEYYRETMRKNLATIRQGIAAADSGDLETAMNKADIAWFAYRHLSEREPICRALQARCIKATNIRYHLPVSTVRHSFPGVA